MAGPAPCANYASEKWRHELLYNPVAGWEVVSPKKLIGFSINRDDADSADADEYAENTYADYRFWSIGPKMYALGRPMVWESGGCRVSAIQAAIPGPTRYGASTA